MRRYLVLLTLALCGCAELRGRRHAREGNRFYLEGNYAEAAKEYEAAERYLPTLSVITLNHGLACRQLMTPGAKTAANEAAVRCALEAFSRLKRLQPRDAKAEQLYLQTLFDADRFDELIAHYTAVLQANPAQLEAINALIQVYARRDDWAESLRWTIRRADVAQTDATAQYAVGVMIWNRLFQKGGNGEVATFDPRQLPKPSPPAGAPGDITGEERARLAALGINYLNKALAIRPTYREAMTYLNLLYRQQSYAYFDQPDRWQAALNQALDWQRKATDLSRSPEIEKQDLEKPNLAPAGPKQGKGS
ncbi:MAG TPA: hypothetical protein VIV60_18040 [Polyangiaceae bacterium]